MIHPESLNCPICYSRYAQFSSVPKSLPSCPHTFCSECLKRILNEPTPRCPLDRICIPSAIKHIDNLPNNLALLQSIETTIDAMPETCTKHKLPLKFFCLEDSQKVCKKCLMYDHRDHEFEHINDLMVEGARKIRSLDKKKHEIGLQRKAAFSSLTNNKNTLWLSNKIEFERMRTILSFKEEEILAEIGVINNLKKVKTLTKIGSSETDKLIESALSLLSDDTCVNRNFLSAYTQEEVEHISIEDEIKDIFTFTDKFQDRTIDALNDFYLSTTDCIQTFQPILCPVEFKAHEEALQEKLELKLSKTNKIVSLAENSKVLTFSPFQEYQQSVPGYQAIREANRVDLNFDKERFNEDKIQAVCYLWEQFGTISHVNLNLRNRQFTDEDLFVLCLYKFWATFQVQKFSISLQDTKVNDKSVSRLFTHKLVTMPHLRYIDINLNNTQITNSSVTELIKHVIPKLKMVEDFRIALFGTQVTSDVVSELCKAIGTHMKRLKTIKLSLGANVDDQCLSVFTQHTLPNLGQVHTFELILSGSRVSDESIIQLCDNVGRQMQNIRVFALATSKTNITDRSLNAFVQKVLLKLNKLERLYLDLSGTIVTDNGVNDLFDKIAEKLSKAKTLKLNFNDCVSVTEENARKIQDNTLARLTEVQSLEVKLAGHLINNETIQHQRQLYPIQMFQ